MAQSQSFETFQSSMHLSYSQMHDGDGYDLGSLAKIDVQEYPKASTLLGDRLQSSSADWRDVEALAVLAGLGDQDARAKLRAAVDHPDNKIRLRVTRELAQLGEDVDSEKPIIEALAHGRMDSAFSNAIDTAPEHNTERVRQAVLNCALEGAEPEARVNAAALALFLAGLTDDPFDWDHRPFFLRFGSDDPKEVAAAHADLLGQIATP